MTYLEVIGCVTALWPPALVAIVIGRIGAVARTDGTIVATTGVASRNAVQGTIPFSLRAALGVTGAEQMFCRASM